MNTGVLFATFALVIAGELPDKTFIACIVMASRHRPLPVWIGGAAALTVQAGVAVVAGRLIELLPKTAVESVIAALFLAGALYLLLVPERRAEARGVALAGGDEGALRDAVGEGGDGRETGGRPLAATVGWRIALTTFSLVALAEFGDITQILIANLTARYHAPVTVFVGATAGFILVSGLGVLGGRALVRVVPLAVVRRISGLAMLGLGIYSLVGLVS